MYLHSRRFSARPYQQRALDSVVSRYSAGTREMLLHLPTGAGKTVIATLIIEALPPFIDEGKVLFVAHRKELLDQTADKLNRHLPELSVSIEQGERRADMAAQVVIASIQSLTKRKDTYPAEQFSAIVCDECHHALSPSWKEVIQHFHDARGRDTLLLGMTATPRRTDGRSIEKVFGEVAYEIGKPALQDLGYLVPIRYFAVKAGLSLEKVKLSGSDFAVGALSAVMNTPRIRGLTVGAWEARGLNKKTLVFCANVPHAHQLRADFEARGYSAEVIEGRTKNRKEILRRFRLGDFPVLLNYGVLTEGFDDPSIDCLLLARPTTSPLVYTQCLGRGLRPSPGKENCTVIDIVDRSTHQLQYGATRFAGLPRGWSCRGRDPFREARSLAGVKVTDPDAFVRIHRASNLEEVQALLMELPEDTVLAGLDGHPVPRYTPAAVPLAETEARLAALKLLEEAGARPTAVDLSDDDGDTARMSIALAEPRVDNETHDHLRWHIGRAVGREVAYVEPKKGARKKAPKTILTSMLPDTTKLTKFEFDSKTNTIHAEVPGLDNDLLAQITRTFEATTGIKLNLSGQLSFGFF